MSRGRHAVHVFVTTLIVVAASAFLAEMVLRARGYRPLSDPEVRKVAAALAIPDSALGWAKKPGRIVASSFVPGGADVVYTHWTRLLRATGPELKDKASKVAIVGCSFTHGFGLTDDATYAWKLQSKWPNREVFNLGASGYGTYQSLLALEEFYRTYHDADLVLYGYIADHGVRNVATNDWLKWESIASPPGTESFPFVRLAGDGTLQTAMISQADGYPDWPLSGSLALVPAFEDVYLKWRRPDPSEAARKEVTLKLMAEMQALAAEHHSVFRVVDLEFGDDADVRQELADLTQGHVPLIDCHEPRTPDNHVPGDAGHPGERVNGLYAECIERGTRNLFR